MLSESVWRCVPGKGCWADERRFGTGGTPATAFRRAPCRDCRGQRVGRLCWQRRPHPDVNSHRVDAIDATKSQGDKVVVVGDFVHFLKAEPTEGSPSGAGAGRCHIKGR